MISMKTKSNAWKDYKDWFFIKISFGLGVEKPIANGEKSVETELPDYLGRIFKRWRMLSVI